jgi:CDP-diacylglycerol--serine O-phosphatidyltransferase
MVSRLPVYSGKTIRMRVPPELVLPVFVCVIFFIALLIGYPWYILSAGTILYLLSLPVGWKSYRNHQRKAEAQTITPAAASTPSEPPSPFLAAADDDSRPARLN